VTFVDVTQMSVAEARISELTRDLRHRISSLETLLDVVPVGVVILQDSQRMDEIRVNRYGAQLLGDGLHGSEGTGPRLMSRVLRLFQGDRELNADEQPLQVATRSGNGVASFEGQLLRSDGDRRDVIITSTPLLDDTGKVSGGIAAIVDISERKNAEARQQVLLYELQHRVKNIIATISALASRTLRSDLPLEQVADAFLGRLRGMSATHELLSRTNWLGASLQQLIEGALRSHSLLDASNVSIRGPDVLLAPNPAATLGMVFYELTTNAVKYGGLSTPGGRVDVWWEVQLASPSNRISLIWAETTGKPVGDVGPLGFGARFVSRSIEYELQGKAEMEPSPTGMRWRLEFPVHQNVLRV
jgi:two-component system CheB/CheR fusion protein